MKENTLRVNAVFGSLVVLVTLLSVQAAQQRNPERRPNPGPPQLIRKANDALRLSAINSVEPVYPPQAVAARIFGTVLVQISIDEGGTVTSANATSGHQLLRDAAVEAARGWTFKPTLVQGKPVKVVGTLSFTFSAPEFVLRDRTIERLKRQIALNPKNPRLHYQLGQAYEANQQDGEALTAFARAIELKPDYGEAQVALGDLNMKLNRYEVALSAFQQAVLLDLKRETKAAAYRAIALIYFRRDQFKEAVEPFKNAIALAPQGSLYLNLGLTYLKLGDKSSALEQQRQLKEINSILAEQLLQRINESK